VVGEGSGGFKRLEGWEWVSPSFLCFVPFFSSVRMTEETEEKEEKEEEEGEKKKKKEEKEEDVEDD
jgi:hypothetical protein